MRRIFTPAVAVIVLTGLACGFTPGAWSQENNALAPVPKLENDCYDWWARHKEVLKVKDGINPEIVLLGDSITHFWGGEPAGPRKNGPKAWDDAFGTKRVLNLGFGWDRTQNVLWRLDNGEFDGLHPKYVVINIGTNNFSGTRNAHESTPAEVADAIKAICARINAKSPDSKIILMGVFPRGASAKDPFRPKIVALNQLLAEFGKAKGIAFLDLGAKMLEPDGSLSREIMGDAVHPTEKGYAIWAAALKEAMKE
jgi:lysophospholipase L1-like esterase